MKPGRLVSQKWREPAHFGLSCFGLGPRSGQQLLRLRTDPVRLKPSLGSVHPLRSLSPLRVYPRTSLYAPQGRGNHSHAPKYAFLNCVLLPYRIGRSGVPRPYNSGKNGICPAHGSVGQTSAALRTTASQNLAAIAGGHTLTEAVLLGTLALLGLIGTKHGGHLLT